MRQCKTCLEYLPEDSFYILRRRGREPRVYADCKACWNHGMASRGKNQKIEAVKLKGGKCEKCGYNKCIDALDFHHLDPLKKEIQISATRLSQSKLNEELNKCVLLCSNCHREAHAKPLSFDKTLWT